MEPIEAIGTARVNPFIYPELNRPNYIHFSGADKDTLPLIINAGLDNFEDLMVDAPGINGFTRASGSIEGALNYNPLTSFKDRMLMEATGEYAVHNVGYLA